jgi:hypothetical protein
MEAALESQPALDRPQPTDQTGNAKRPRSPAAYSKVKSDGLDLGDWAEHSRQAATIRERALRDLRVRKAFEQALSRTHRAQYHLRIDYSAGPRRPESGPQEAARSGSTSGAPEPLVTSKQPLETGG